MIQCPNSNKRLLLFIYEILTFSFGRKVSTRKKCSLRTKFVPLLFLVLSSIFLSVEVYAQIPTVTFENPTNSSTSVPLSPIFTMKANHKIDKRITHEYPIMDTLTAEPTADLPTFVILPKSLYDSLGCDSSGCSNARRDSLLRFFFFPGTFTLQGDSTLKFVLSHPLLPSTEYIALAINVRLIVYLGLPGQYDTVLIQRASTTFTTTEGVYRFVSFDKKHINCNESIGVILNRSLTSLSPTQRENLITLQKIDSITNTGGNAIYSTTTISKNVSVNTSDNKYLQVTPSAPLDPASIYLLKVNMGTLTGNPMDNRETEISVRRGVEINLIMSSYYNNDTIPDSLYILPRRGKAYFSNGDTAKIYAPKTQSGWHFNHWKVRNNLGEFVAQSNDLTIPVSCANAGDMSFEAVYARKDSVDIIVSDTNDFIISVYRTDDGNASSYTLVGGEGTYKLGAQQKLMVVAGASTSGHIFSHWNSDLSGGQLGDITSRVIVVGNWGVNGHLGGGRLFDPPAPTFVEYCACPEVADEDGNNGQGIDRCKFNNILDIVPTDCQNTGNQSALVSFTATVKPEFEECYGISAVAGTIFEEFDPPVETASGSVMSRESSSCSKVVFFVKRKTEALKTLTVETELLKKSYYTGEYGKDVRIEVRRIDCNGKVIDVWLPKSPSDQKQYSCGDIVEIKAVVDIREDGFILRNWSTASGYDFPSPAGPSPDPAMIFTLEMTQDRKVKAFFEEKFRLLRVGFYVNTQYGTLNTSNITWVSAKALKTNTELDRIEVFRTGTTNDGFETKVLFEFNDHLDLNSLSGRIAFSDMNTRTHYNTVNWTTGHKLYISNSTNTELLTGDSKIAVFYVRQGGTGSLAIPKGQQFSIEVKPGILNTDSPQKPVYTKGGKVLKAAKPQETILPGLKIMYKSAYALKSGEGQFYIWLPLLGWQIIEYEECIDLITSGSIVRYSYRETRDPQPIKFKTPLPGGYSPYPPNFNLSDPESMSTSDDYVEICENDSHTYDEVLAIFSDMDKGDVVVLGGYNIDKDAGSAQKAIKDIGKGIYKGIKNAGDKKYGQKPADPPFPGWVDKNFTPDDYKFSNDIISNIITMIELNLGDLPDYLDRYTFPVSWGNKFNSRSPQSFTNGWILNTYHYLLIP